MTTVAIVGNRTGFTEEYVHKVLNKVLSLNAGDRIISGGAQGVDTYAAIWARNHNLIVKAYFPDFSKPSPQRYFDRNKLIAEAADLVIAFNNKAGTGGTFHTISEAQKLGKEVLEVGVDFPV